MVAILDTTLKDERTILNLINTDFGIKTDSAMIRFRIVHDGDY